MSGHRVLGVITARGGSKGVPNKNIHPVCGLPLIAWTIIAAQEASCLDRLILSTDDPEISKTAQQYGCDVPFLRPPELATDIASSIDVLSHALKSLPEHYDLVVLLQPTSPLRTGADIDGAVSLLLQSGAPSVISVTTTKEPPYWMFTLAPDGSLQPLFSDDQRPSRRQDAPSSYLPNGGIYVASVERFLKQRMLIMPGTLPWIMPAERSIDIDIQEDLEYLEYLCVRYPEWVPIWKG